jgi:hypothetical protein
MTERSSVPSRHPLYPRNPRLNLGGASQCPVPEVRLTISAALAVPSGVRLLGIFPICLRQRALPGTPIAAGICDFETGRSRGLV